MIELILLLFLSCTNQDDIFDEIELNSKNKICVYGESEDMSFSVCSKK